MNSFENPYFNPEAKIESTRRYEASPIIAGEIFESRTVFERPITPDTRICLVGDGQGMDTKLFREMGVKSENISSVNYEQEEVSAANEGVLKDTGVKMRQGDATNRDSLKEAGIEEGDYDLVTLMHVLEVPPIKGEAERSLVENVHAILKKDGELLVTQYKHKFTRDERDIQKQNGIEEITRDSLVQRYGNDAWEERFFEENGVRWEEGMRYGEISNVRSKDELIRLFEPYFEVRCEETDHEYVLKMKKK